MCHTMGMVTFAAWFLKKKRQKVIFIFWQGDYVFSFPSNFETVMPNSTQVSHFRVEPHFYFWLVSRVAIGFPNGPSSLRQRQR